MSFDIPSRYDVLKSLSFCYFQKHFLVAYVGGLFFKTSIKLTSLASMNYKSETYIKVH
jgi:hypothetical protein